jgi:hypothetical protein
MHARACNVGNLHPECNPKQVAESFFSRALERSRRAHGLQPGRFRESELVVIEAHEGLGGQFIRVGDMQQVSRPTGQVKAVLKISTRCQGDQSHTSSCLAS